MNPRDDQDPDAPFEQQPVEDAAGDLPGGDSLAQQLRDAEDRVLRAQAELENFRKRSRREYEDAIRYREIDLLRDLLPVLDTVRRAIDASETTADATRMRSVSSSNASTRCDRNGRIGFSGTLFGPCCSAF